MMSYAKRSDGPDKKIHILSSLFSLLLKCKLISFILNVFPSLFKRFFVRSTLTIENISQLLFYLYLGIETRKYFLIFKC